MDGREKKVYVQANEFYNAGSYSQAVKVLENANCDFSCESLILYGLCLSGAGEHDAAVTKLRQAVTLEPSNFRAAYNLAFLADKNGDGALAEEYYLKTIELNPSHAGAYNNLALCYRQQQKIEQAEQLCSRGLDAVPDSCELLFTLGGILTATARADQALDIYRRACLLAPEMLFARSNVLLCMNYQKISEQEAIKEYKAWDAACVRYSKIPETDFSGYHYSGDKITLGYYSADFRIHSVAYFMESVIHFHDRDRFEISLFSDVKHSDDTTGRFREMADHFYDVSGMDNKALNKFIRNKKLDAVIDLAGHTGSRMEVFARRVAPVQLTYMGYPNTSGVSNMDFRLTDDIVDPPDCGNYYTEKLLYISGGMWAYSPMSEAPEPSPPPFVKNGYLTFGSFNNIAKMSDETFRCWAGILREVPNSRLLLKSRMLASDYVRNIMTEHFERCGVDASRLIFLSHADTVLEHLKCYNQIDLGLDPFPYNGTTTTYEALWMGVPVLTLAGDNHAGRVGQSIMSRLGFEAFVANSRGAYVKTAKMLAAKPELLVNLRTALRGILAGSGACDGKRVAYHIEQHLIKILAG